MEEGFQGRFSFKMKHMKTEKKKSLLAHSCKAISIGLMAWVAGTVAICLFEAMEKPRHDSREEEKQ